jgi:hypothetical protein
VYRYRSVDASGEAVAFAPSATVQLELSPSLAPIVAPTGSGTATTQLPRTVIDFRTAALPAPRAALITSSPSDAIGVANLDGTTPLEISLDLADAQVGDTLRIYVFGATREAQPRPLLLSRSAALTGALFDVNTQVATIGEAQLDLAAGTTNLTPRIAEGTLQIAFALARGTYQTPVRLMDVDATSAGAQGPVLDVTPPTLIGLSSTGTNLATFISDQRDVVIVGRADEEIRACEVTLPGGANNGVLAQTVASNAQGVFVAAPVAVGVVAGASQPLTADVVIYDRASNRAVSTTQVAVRQVGGVGPAAAVPGAAQLEVEVRDARTLAPLAGARVFTHEDQAGVVTQVAFTTTDANGRAQLNLGAVGEALVTVEATGFNLLTIHGVQAARVSLLLETRSPRTPAWSTALRPRRWCRPALPRGRNWPVRSVRPRSAPACPAPSRCSPQTRLRPPSPSRPTRFCAASRSRRRSLRPPPRPRSPRWNSTRSSTPRRSRSRTELSPDPQPRSTSAR